MVRKICPVCDQQVSENNYCKICKRFVKSPYLQNVNFHLNEQHPENESVCGYHNPYMEADHHQDNGAGQKKPSAKPGATYNQSQPGSTYNQSQPGSTYNQSEPYGQRPGMYPSSAPVQPAHNQGKYTTAAVIIVIFVLILVISTALAVAQRDSYDGYQSGNSYNNVEEEYSFIDYTEEEVKAWGINCSGYDHFPANGEDLADSMREYLKDQSYGYTIQLDEIYNDNYTYKYKDEEELSYYNVSRSFTLVTEQSVEDEYEYVELDYDTATGDTHYYSSYLKNAEASSYYLEQFLTLMEAQCQISPEESTVLALMAEMETTLGRGDSYYNSMGIFDVEVYTSEGMTSVYIRYSDPEALGQSVL